MGDNERRLEKNTLFAMRYGTRGKTLKQLAEMKPLTRWMRFKQWLFGIRCLTCDVKLNDRYWSTRYPAKKFDALIRMICMDRRQCVECALAEERVEREQSDGHSAR